MILFSISEQLCHLCNPKPFSIQACIDENLDMVKLLCEKGANIEARDNEGWTPLHAAASAGNIDIAQ